MATIVRPPSAAPGQSVVLRHVTWDTYERLLADDPERRVPRYFYDRGVLEIVSPATGHEEDALTVALFVEIVAAVRGIAIRSVGSMTYQRPDLERAFEPDASFYVHREPDVRGVPQIELAVHPPPDLVVEMEFTRSALDKLALYARAGVPEVWRCSPAGVVIHRLHQDAYREASDSGVLPPVTGEVLTRFLAQSRVTPRPEWFWSVSDWARSRAANG